MSTPNFGTLLRSVTTKFARAHVLKEGVEAQATYHDFIRAIQSSPVLTQQYLLFEHLQEKGIQRELALEYIQGALKGVQSFTGQELTNAATQLTEQFKSGVVETTALESAIQTLMLEAVALPGQGKLRAYYNALQLVTESVTQPIVDVALPAVLEEGISLTELLAGAVVPLTEQLSNLSETERQLLFTATGSDKAAQQALFENYYQQAQALLAEHTDSSAYARLQHMSYHPDTAAEDIVDMHLLLSPEA